MPEDCHVMTVTFESEINWQQAYFEGVLMSGYESGACGWQSVGACWQLFTACGFCGAQLSAKQAFFR